MMQLSCGNASVTVMALWLSALGAAPLWAKGVRGP